ncbi:hypothetical protein L208DRAFT_1301887, partial [Tricholoma matsutake]
TSGGIMCGRAFCNTFSLADAPDLEMDMDLMISVPGKVYLYESVSDSANLDPVNVKAKCILKADMSQTLGPILTKLSCKYSPIRKPNIRIHTYEDSDWTIKGKYDTAVGDDEEIMWMKINNEYVLPMWLVSLMTLFQTIF